MDLLKLNYKYIIIAIAAIGILFYFYDSENKKNTVQKELLERIKVLEDKNNSADILVDSLENEIKSLQKKYPQTYTSNESKRIKELELQLKALKDSKTTYVNDSLSVSELEKYFKNFLYK